MDRSKYRATEVNTLLAQEKEQESLSPYGGKDEFHKFDDGDNIFRIYPAHPNYKSFTEFQCKNFLPVEVEKEKNGIKSKELVRRPFFSAIYHSKIMPKDLVNEYFGFVKTVVKDSVSDQEYKRIFNAMTRSGKVGDPTSDGIKSTESWVVYADKYHGDSKVFGILELKKSMKSQMTSIIAEHAKTGGIDPFTGVDDGCKIIITKDKAAGEKNANDWYKVRLESKWEDVPGRGKSQFYPATPLSDEDLDRFDKVMALKERYGNCYKLEDFLGQLEGLRRFDKINNINVFNYQEWIELVNELSVIAEQLPSKDEEGELSDSDVVIQPQVQQRSIPVELPQPKQPQVVAKSGTSESLEERIAKLKNGLVKQPETATATPKDDLPF